jgi:hypothetical protein
VTPDEAAKFLANDDEPELIASGGPKKPAEDDLMDDIE